MDTTSVAPATRPDTREVRALAFYRARGREIVRTGPHTYLVPSCSGGRTYRVDLRDDEETCECRDFEIRGENCKHILAACLLRAKRRGTTARRLGALEERLRNELMDEGERLELKERVLRVRRGIEARGV